MRNEFFSNVSKDFEILILNTNAIFRKKTARIFKVFIKLSSDWDWGWGWGWEWDMGIGNGNRKREYPKSQKMTL